MKSLFASGGEGRVFDFLSKNSRQFKLVAAPRAIADLYYIERDQVPDLGRKISVISIANLASVSSLGDNDDQNRLQQSITYVVVDPDGEETRITQLRELHPGLMFIGLGQHLVPALLARAGHRATEQLDALKMPTDVLLVLATPRSGSSHLGDIIGQMGLGVAREHLRPTIIELLTSEYKFNRTAAIRNFFKLEAVNGWVSTKLITHFVQALLEKGSVRYFNDALKGVRCHVVGLDRRDRVAQAVSGHIASQRGTWHAFEGKTDESRLRQNVSYDFDAMLARYLSYAQQGSFLESCRSMLRQFEVLYYEADIDGRPLRDIAERIARAVPVPKSSLQRERFSESGRLKMASGINRELAERFAEELGRRFQK